MLSLYFAFSSPGRLLERIVLYVAVFFNLRAASYSMSRFWQPKDKVPIAEGYNRGIARSKIVIRDLNALGSAWGATVCLWIMIYAKGGFEK